MSRGRETKYAAHGVRLHPVPQREQFLKRDYFYPCQRCGDLWPRKQLSREPVTRLLVCKNDYDIPSVVDTRSRRLDEAHFRRFDRLGLNLEELF